MKSLTGHLGIIIVLFLILFSCTATLTGPDSVRGELPRELTAAEKKIVNADQQFSYELFKNSVSAASGENVLISPISISVALSMAMNGAEEETFEAMKNTLKLSEMTLDEINEGFHSLVELLTELDPDVEFMVANSIWFREGLPVREDFLNRLNEWFNASSESLDFSSGQSVERINDWVRVNTKGKIDSIIDEISEEMVMFLINAIYFKGDWLRKFDVDRTEKGDFHLENGDIKTVDMMSLEGPFAAYFSEEIQMVELPYGDSLYTMSLLLPADPETNIEQFVDQKINARNLAEWRSNLSAGAKNVFVQLPRFEIEFELSLNDLLKEMGMEIAFDERNANFKGIADLSLQNISIGEVKHKAVIRVDEDGSEAAAVTNVGLVVTSMPPSIRADRPFVFILHERESGTNLFMGKVVSP